MSVNTIVEDKSALKILAGAKFRDLAVHEGTPEEYPAIVIMSDGSPNGTKVMIYGVEVPFSDMSFYCDTHEDYPSCSMSLTTQDVELNGIKVRKSITLRKES